MTKQDISILGKEDAFKLIGNEWMLDCRKLFKKTLGLHFWRMTSRKS